MKTFILLADLEIPTGDEQSRYIGDVFLTSIKAKSTSDAHSKHKYAIGDEVNSGTIESLRLVIVD